MMDRALAYSDDDLIGGRDNTFSSWPKSGNCWVDSMSQCNDKSSMNAENQCDRREGEALAASFVDEKWVQHPSATKNQRKTDRPS